MATWETSPGGRAHRHGVDHQARFVDRLVEQRRILRAIADARRQRGSVLLLTGEAGVGKTRLCTALLARQRATGALVLRGAAGADPHQPALAAVVDSLRSVEADAGARVWRALGARASRLAAVLPELAGRREPAAVVEEPLVFQDLMEAAAEAAGQAPVIWLLDDLQRADTTTWHFLWYLCRHVASRRFVVLGSCRDDDLASAQVDGPPLLALSCDQGALEVHLDRFGRTDTERLARSVAGGVLPSGAISRIVKRSAGNPRAAIELVESAVAGSADRIPPSIRHAVALRASKLSPPAGEMLEALAVLEPAPAVSVVLALPGATEAALSELTDHGLVQVTGSQKGAVIRFRHPLYRDALCERTTWAHRRALHRQVAVVLERMHDRRDVAAIVLAARHRELGGDVARAVQELKAAACGLRGAGEARAAGDLLLAILHVLERHPGVARSRSRVLLWAMRELSLAGRWAEVLPSAQRAWRLPVRRPGGEHAQLAAILGACLWMTGRVEEGSTLLDTHAARLERAGRASVAPWLPAAASAAALVEGHLKKARHFCDVALHSVEPGVRGFAECLAVAVRYRSDHDREAAAEAFDALSGRALADGRSELAAFARWNRARMTTRLEDAVRLQAAGDPVTTALSRLLAGTILLLEGHESRAAAVLDQAGCELGAAAPILAPLLDGLLAHVDLHRGDLDRARLRLEPWGGERAEMSSPARAIVLGAQGWLAWESDLLAAAVSRWWECAGACAASGYGLLESRPLLLPLQVDALVRLGRADEARRAVQAVEPGGEPDRFSRASLAAARFRLVPSTESWDRARALAAAAPWPFLEVLLGCWCAEHLGSRIAGEAALRLASAIGAPRAAERARRALAALAVTEVTPRRHATAPRLSLRELQVAVLVADGLSNPAIAGRLNVSAATVTTHVKHILAKLGFRSRARLAAWVSEQRIRSWENDVLLRLGRKVLAQSQADAASSGASATR